jgi:hypothetical protein
MRHLAVAPGSGNGTAVPIWQWQILAAAAWCNSLRAAHEPPCVVQRLGCPPQICTGSGLTTSTLQLLPSGGWSLDWKKQLCQLF